MTFYVGDKFEGAKGHYAKLGKHKKSVACLYINKLDDVDLDVLREIVTRQMPKKPLCDRGKARPAQSFED